MSDFIEVINPRTKICTLIKNGEPVAIYKMEQCDRCSSLSKLDEFGYQRGYDQGDKIIWFCAGCR